MYCITEDISMHVLPIQVWKCHVRVVIGPDMSDTGRRSRIPQQLVSISISFRQALYISELMVSPTVQQCV